MSSSFRVFDPAAGRQGLDRPDSALPLQRVPPEPSNAPGGRVATALLVVPDREVTDALQAGLRHLGVQRIVAAGSLAAVHDLLARRLTGDLAVVSVQFGSDTAGVIQALRERGWHRVIVFTPTGAVGPVLSAVQAGATGALSWPGTAPDLPGDPPAADVLSPREIQVVTLVADGRSNKEIGLRLSLSALTVKSHLARIGRKLGVGDRAHIVAVACRAGVIS